MRLGRNAKRAIAARSADANQGELVPTDEDLGNDHRAALWQPLGERIDEDELTVGVEHVGQTRAIEADATREPLARGVGDEVDLGLFGSLRRARLAQHETKARPNGADHSARSMHERTTTCRPYLGTGGIPLADRPAGRSAAPARPSALGEAELRREEWAVRAGRPGGCQTE